MRWLYKLLVGGSRLQIAQTLIGQCWITHVLAISLGGNKELMVMSWMKLRVTGPTRVYLRCERD